MQLSPQRQLHVLDPGGRYQPLINSLDLDCQIHSAVNLDQLLSSVMSSFGAIGMVSIEPDRDPRQLTETLSGIHRSSRDAATAVLFAVGGPEIKALQRELLIAGFTMVVGSAAEFDRVQAAARRYWNSLHWPEMNVEDSVAGNLPWRAIE